MTGKGKSRQHQGQKRADIHQNYCFVGNSAATVEDVPLYSRTSRPENTTNSILARRMAAMAARPCFSSNSAASAYVFAFPDASKDPTRIANTLPYVKNA